MDPSSITLVCLAFLAFIVVMVNVKVWPAHKLGNIGGTGSQNWAKGGWRGQNGGNMHYMHSFIMSCSHKKLQLDMQTIRYTKKLFK